MNHITKFHQATLLHHNGKLRKNDRGSIKCARMTKRQYLIAFLVGLTRCFTVPYPCQARKITSHQRNSKKGLLVHTSPCTPLHNSPFFSLSQTRDFQLSFFTLISAVSHLPRARTSAPRRPPAVAVTRFQLVVLTISDVNKMHGENASRTFLCVFLCHPVSLSSTHCQAEVSQRCAPTSCKPSPSASI